MHSYDIWELIFIAIYCSIPIESFYNCTAIFHFNIWAITVILHPYPRGLLLEWVYKEDTRLNVQHFVNKIEDKLTKFIVKTPHWNNP